MSSDVAWRPVLPRGHSNYSFKWEKSSKTSLPRRNILITAALPYVNNVPHLGNLIGCILSADVYARFTRLMGYNTCYICGTDEYGTATEVKATQEKTTPKELCDKYFAIHESIYKWFKISFDHFGRTTNAAQTPIAHDIFLKLNSKGLILQKEVPQLYCGNCKRFLADRLVHGTCPGCKTVGARGDQCEVCDKLYQADELLNPFCKICQTAPEVKSSKQLFLDLPKLSGELKQWAQKASSLWTPNAQGITKAWLDGELKERCITRDLKWGTPVPLDCYRDKVFYVWFDAPIGYMSITATHDPQNWHKWWFKGGETELVQFMGKDNVAFHTIMFPATLMGTGDSYNLVHRLSVCEYLQYSNGRKFSKTHKTGVFGDDCMSSGLSCDVWRYYLLRNRPESSDTVFSWQALQQQHDGELLAILGNFCYRSLKLTAKQCKGHVPVIEPTDMSESDRDFIRGVNACLGKYIEALEHIQIRQGLTLLLDAARLGNGYLQKAQPWKTDSPVSISLTVHLVRLLAIMAEPFVPEFSEAIFKQMRLTQPSRLDLLFDTTCLASHCIGAPEYIFTRLDRNLLSDLEQQFN